MSSADTDPRQARDLFPIFVGSGRSGTTLVQSIFSSHSNLAVAHETLFIPRLARRAYFQTPDLSADRFVNDLLRDEQFERLGVDGKSLRAELSAWPPTDYAEAVRVVMTMFARNRGKTRYGDKTPGYVLHLETIGSLFPEARFVHVVRDGRDVALSYMDTRFGPDSIGAGAIYWSERVRAGRTAGTTLGPARYHELRYEDVVDQPDETIRAVCSFLGLDFEPGMLDYHLDGSSFRASTADPTAHAGIEKPPTSGLRDWRQEMSHADQRLFEVLAGDLLDDLGYERAHRKTGVGAYLRASAARGSWQGRRLSSVTGRVMRRLSSRSTRR